METFNQILEKVKQDYEDVTADGGGNAYSRLSTIFEELDGYMREQMQAMTSQDIKAIISRISAGEDLSSEDLALVKMWIVGDAETYTRLENNVQEWKKELDRLVNEINEMRDKPADVQTAVKLRGLFRDGVRVISDIFFYVEQKDRVARFQEATRQLDAQERALLVDLLEQKMSSKEY
ncbi:MAG: hypothetical protein ACLFPX_06430 [Candidatus Omnitrophota bacterium]